MSDEILFVEEDTLPLYAERSGNGKRLELLWGDRVHLLGSGGGRDPARIDAGPFASVHFEETSAGALRPVPGDRPLRGAYVVAGLIYGLVNVRTDGERILCATLNEKSRGWDVQSFTSRF